MDQGNNDKKEGQGWIKVTTTRGKVKEYSTTRMDQGNNDKKEGQVILYYKDGSR